MKATDRERVEREDLVTFINACFACSGQFEYYGDGRGVEVSIQFLHEYVLGNYRRLYARTLAAGINLFNQRQIIVGLLAAGAASLTPAELREEGELIDTALARMPVAHAMRTFELLGHRKVNNRRARAIVRAWFAARRDLAFAALKYRPKVRAAVRHHHVRVGSDVIQFLREGGARREPYAHPTFEAFRRARTDPEKLYALPFTIAEGFAARHKIPREVFLRRIEPMMTAAERLRMQSSAEQPPDVDLMRVPLTRLCMYVLSLPTEARLAGRETLGAALSVAADRALARSPLQLGRVALVVDRSHSAGGIERRPNRPLAVALGTHALLSAASRAFKAFWTPQRDDGGEPWTVRAGGPTDLATPLLDALAWAPDLVVIVSDGFENFPIGGVSEVVRVFRAQMDPTRRVAFVHMNPVFDAERFAPRALASGVPTVGLRDAEDLPVMLSFARCADGTGSLAELIAFLDLRVREFLSAEVRP